MKIYTITIQHTYTVEAKNKQEALDSLDRNDYDGEEIIEVDWYENLDKPKVI